MKMLRWWRWNRKLEKKMPISPCYALPHHTGPS